MGYIVKRGVYYRGCFHLGKEMQTLSLRQAFDLQVSVVCCFMTFGAKKGSPDRLCPNEGHSYHKGSIDPRKMNM